MIATSQAYKDAIRSGMPQRILIDMGDVILTNEDVSVSSGGLKFEDRFNEENELTFGATPSNSVSVALINSDGFFNDYEFKTLKAAVGVLIETNRFARVGSVMVEIGSGGKTFAGQTIQPYLLEDGVACSVQPSFAVKSIVVNNGIVYCFGSSSDDVFIFRMSGWSSLPDWRSLDVYDWSKFSNTNTVISTPKFNAHVKKKISGLIRDHKGIVIHGSIISDFLHENRRNVYEYIKLGTFIADSDEIVRKSIISLDGNDRMLLFDDVLIDEVGLSYPITLLQMVNRICEYIGVEFGDSDFINSDLIVSQRPDDFEEATTREVLSWIAEAACSYAKFDRDGNLRLKWFEKADASFDESTFSAFDPMVYQVSSVSGLKVRNSNSYIESIYGSGNTYLIQNNPFLRPEDNASTFSLTRSSSSPILDRVAAFEPFNPASGTLFGDFSIEAGDIVRVVKGGRAYSVPIYSANTSWNGSSMTNIENSGSKQRTVPTLKQREEYSSGRNSYNTSQAIGGLGGRASALEESAAYARVDIDENRGKILLIAGEESFDKIDGKKSLSQAYVDINGAKAEIELRVEKDGVISAINQTPETVTIQAKRIDLSGYVTASQLSSSIAALENAIATEMYIGKFSCGSTFKMGGTEIAKHRKNFLTSASLSYGNREKYYVYNKDETESIGVVYVYGKATLNTNDDDIYFLDWE